MTSHYSRRSALAFAGLVTAVPVLAACSSKKADASASSSARVKPTSSVPTGMPEGKGSGKADGVFPRKVAHFKGSTEIKKAFPKQADKLGAIKDVGSRKSPSVEDIGNLSPDLILVNQAGKDDIDALYKSLSEVAPTVVTQGKSEAWKQDLLLMADALGKPDTAKKWIETYEADAAKAGTTIEGSPTVSLLRKTSDKLRIFGAVSLAGSVLSDMGVARPSTQTFTDNGSKDISSETLAEAEADWILYGAQKTPKDEKDKDRNNTELTAIPLWAGLKAVNDKHAVRVDDDAFFLNAGPTAARLVMTTVADTLPKKK